MKAHFSFFFFSFLMQFPSFSKKTLITTAIVVGAVFITGAGVTLASHSSFSRPHLTSDQKTALESAKKSGDTQLVQNLLKEYGISVPENGMMGGRDEKGPDLSALSAEDKTAFETARQNRDHVSAKAILEKYGITPPERGMMGGRDEKGPDLSALSVEDKTAFETARQNRDHASAKAILEKYGITPAQKKK